MTAAFEHSLIRRSLVFVFSLYLLNFLFLGFYLGPFDYDHLSAYYEIAWRFWRTGQGLPGFNPFLQGGRTLGGDPQIPLFNPVVALVPLIGPTWTIKLEMLAQLALGGFGLKQLCQRFHYSPSQEALSLLLFLSGGGIVSKFLVGHVTLGFYFLFPLFLSLSYQFSDKTKSWSQTYSVVAAYFLLCAYSNLHKPNFLIYFVPILFCEAVLRSGIERNPRPFLLVAAGSFFAAGINAVTYYPAWLYFSSFPRPDNGEGVAVPLYTFFANLLLPLKAIPKAWYGPRFMPRHEYNIFLGPVALFFAVSGLRKLKASDTKMVALVATAALCTLVGLGAAEGGISLFPFSWLREVWPGFQSVRVATRFWFVPYFVLALLAARHFKMPNSKGLRVLVFVFGLLPLLASATINLMKTSVQAQTTQWHGNSKTKSDPEWIDNDITSSYFPIRAGNGALNSVENLAFPRNTLLREAPLLNFEVSAPAEVKIQWENWSRISVIASSRNKEPFHLSLNLNPHPFWKFEGQGQVISVRQGPLSIESVDGRLNGMLVFQQPGVNPGAMVSLIFLVLFLLASFTALAFQRRAKLQSKT